MKVKFWSWTGGPVAEFGEKIYDFNPTKLIELSERYDVLIHNIKNGKNSFQEVKLVFLDKKGDCCMVR